MRFITWLAVASLAGLIIVAYANSLGAALTLDSTLIIGLDPRIRTWSAENLRSIWTESYWGPFARSDLYRPVSTLSVLASGACYVRAAGASGRAKVGWLGLAGVVATWGVFAKENAVMVIVVAQLYDAFWRWPAIHAPHLGARIKAAAWEIGLKGWVAFIPAVALLWFVRHRLGAALTPAGYSFVDNPILYAGSLQGVLTAIGVVGRYLTLWPLPRGLSCDYSYNAIPLHGEGYLWWHDFVPWLSLVVVGALIWLILRWRESHRLAAWGLAFCFLILLPVSNILLRIGSIMGERFLYLPSLGLCAAVAVALDAVGRRSWRDGMPPRRRFRGFALPALVIGALTARTVARSADWRDDLSLWQSAVTAVPNSFKTHLGLSTARWENGKDELALDAAIASAETAQRILDRVPLPIERRTRSVSGQLGMFIG